MKIYNSILEAIGNTPLVSLDRMTEGLDGHILAKLDHLNPGAAKKDRIALQIIEDAEKAGTLSPSQHVIELTSGNTGAGVAIVCSIKGYPFIAVMSKGNSPERATMMRAFGAEVVLVDQAPGSIPGQVSGEDLHLVDLKTTEIEKEKNAFRINQFLNEGNTRAHIATGQEFIEQSEGNIDCFCDFSGTGGTFAGIASALKDYNSDIKCFVIEPESSPALAGKEIKNTSHKIQGGGYSRKELELFNRDHIDGFLTVSNQKAIECARLLAAKEGIFAGFSSGANLAGALQLLKGDMKGKTIIIMINDSGLKYLSTDLWG